MVPAYCSNGVVDPRSEARLILPASGTSVPMPSGQVVLSGKFQGAVDANPGILDLSPTMHIEAGHRYGLEFAFPGRT